MYQIQQRKYNLWKPLRRMRGSIQTGILPTHPGMEGKPDRWNWKYSGHTATTITPHLAHAPGLL